jgi:hypothetical protein
VRALPLNTPKRGREGVTEIVVHSLTLVEIVPTSTISETDGACHSLLLKEK